jgi:catechol 2,3-dioxygenase-like lactoylglutathione lyase family enzyme
VCRLRHVGIVTADIEKSILFYEYLGFNIQKDLLESGNFIDSFSSLEKVCVRTVKMVLSNGDMVELLSWKSHPEIVENRRLTQVGCSHIAITVSNLDDTYDMLCKKGIKFRSSPKTSPEGNVKVVFCKDPNGVFIELVEEL